MDFTSTLTWSELNEIIQENYKVFFPGNQEKDIASPFPIFQFLTGVMLGNSLMWSGSVAENSIINPICRQEGLEADIMIMSPDFVISSDLQNVLFEEIPDEPGYVRVEAVDGIDNNELFCVKEVTSSNGSHLYTVANLALPDVYVDFLNPGKNILLQSIFDTFDFENFSVKQQPHGPALAHTIHGISPVFELITRPMKTVYKFLGHIGTRVLGLFNESPKHGDKRYQECSPKKFSGRRLPNIGLMVDVCPSIKCEGWPHKALRFLHRERSWPDRNILDKLLEGDFHLVYKPVSPSSQDSVEWRISFSKAEITLFQSMDAFQVYCYRIFKAIYYSELTLPKVLCSYHMKTIFLWACERIPSEMWIESNLAQIIMGLLDHLLHCLVTKNCPHYFIPENNLFACVHQDFLHILAKVVSRIRRNPERYPLKQIYSNNDDQSADSVTENQVEITFDDIDLD